jgi:hypothetical protein
MRSLLVLAAICALVVATPAAASDKTSMDKRSRVFVALLKDCHTAVGAAITVMEGSDPITASTAVNGAKGVCARVRDRMATADTTHFRDQAIDCEVATDSYTRGLGRVSNYIDDAKPSDLAAATTYIGEGAAGYTACIHEINVRRAVYRLSELK